MKKFKLNSEITLTEEQMKDIAEAYNEPESEYPIFKRSKLGGYIVKFRAVKGGIILWGKTNSYSVGDYSDTWIAHSNSDTWEDITYDSERDLWDGQPIYCWSDDETHCRTIRFYDAINRCPYKYEGSRAGCRYDNYEAIPSDRYNDWVLEAYKTLDK